jgi:hypothetical protein
MRRVESLRSWPQTSSERSVYAGRYRASTAGNDCQSPEAAVSLHYSGPGSIPAPLIPEYQARHPDYGASLYRNRRAPRGHGPPPSCTDPSAQAEIASPQPRFSIAGDGESGWRWGSPFPGRPGGSSPGAGNLPALEAVEIRLRLLRRLSNGVAAVAEIDRRRGRGGTISPAASSRLPCAAAGAAQPAGLQVAPVTL